MYALLKKCKVFDGVSEEYLKALLAKDNLINIDKGDFLFHKGDLGHGMYVVLKGNLDVVLENGAKSKDILASVTAGSIIGEINLITEAKRSAGVIATSNAKLLFLDGHAFKQQIETNNIDALRLGFNISYTLAARLAKTDEILLSAQKRLQPRVQREIEIVRERLLADILL